MLHHDKSRTPKSRIPKKRITKAALVSGPTSAVLLNQRSASQAIAQAIRALTFYRLQWCNALKNLGMDTLGKLRPVLAEPAPFRGSRSLTGPISNADPPCEPRLAVALGLYRAALPS